MGQAAGVPVLVVLVAAGDKVGGKKGNGQLQMASNASHRNKDFMVF